MLTLDGFYSDFDDTNIKRGIETCWYGWCAASSPTGLESTDGVITGGTFWRRGRVNNRYYVRKAKLYQGSHVEHEGEDVRNVTADISFCAPTATSHSRMNAGTAPGGTGATDSADLPLDPSGTFTDLLDYSDPTLICLTDPLGWGGGAPGGRQHGYYNDRIVEDELWQFLYRHREGTRRRLPQPRSIPVSDT